MCVLVCACSHVVCIHVLMHVYVSVCTYLCECAHVCLCLCVYLCVHLCLCMCVCVCVRRKWVGESGTVAVPCPCGDVQMQNKRGCKDKMSSSDRDHAGQCWQREGGPWRSRRWEALVSRAGLLLGRDMLVRADDNLGRGRRVSVLHVWTWRYCCDLWAVCP